MTAAWHIDRLDRFMTSGNLGSAGGYSGPKIYSGTVSNTLLVGIYDLLSIWGSAGG